MAISNCECKQVECTFVSVYVKSHGVIEELIVIASRTATNGQPHSFVHLPLIIAVLQE